MLVLIDNQTGQIMAYLPMRISDMSEAIAFMHGGAALSVRLWDRFSVRHVD